MACSAFFDHPSDIQGFALSFADDHKQGEVVAEHKSGASWLQVAEDLIKDSPGRQWGGGQRQRDRGRIGALMDQGLEDSTVTSLEGLGQQNMELGWVSIAVDLTEAVHALGHGFPMLLGEGLLGALRFVGQAGCGSVHDGVIQDVDSGHKGRW